MAHETDKPYLMQTNINKLLIEFADSLLKDDKLFIWFPKVDILVVGGSALAMKYNFRSTVDIDAQIKCNASVDSHINKIASKYKIPKDWINECFMKTPSFSPFLWCEAILVMQRTTGDRYVNVYVVSDLDQLCMKTVAERNIKDMNDIRQLTLKLVQNSNIKFQDYEKRMCELYGPDKKASDKTRQAVRYGLRR